MLDLGMLEGAVKFLEPFLGDPEKVGVPLVREP